MSSFTLSREVDAPAETVFAVATDFENLPRFVRGIARIEVLDEGPLRIGSRWRETRVMFGKEATEQMELTVLEPPQHYETRAESCGCRYTTGVRVTEVDEGKSRVEFSFDAKPLSFFARMMAFLMKPIMNACKKETQKDLEDIRAEAERRHASAGSSAATAAVE